jgi:hypothetical protein
LAPVHADIDEKDHFVAGNTTREADEPVDPRRDEVWERFWQTIEEIRERNKDKDPDEEFAFITQVVEEVRQEQYERAQREAKDGR